MKSFTREELEALNMDEAQILAILRNQESSAIVPIRNEPVNMTASHNELQITSISDIVKYSQGNIVELPSFDGEHPFVVKLKRPSMLNMVKSGKIPNGLLNQATELFQKGANALGRDNTISDMYDIMESICKEALVQPSYKELESAGINLTDEQMMAIFSYTQQGVKALESFR